MSTVIIRPREKKTVSANILEINIGLVHVGRPNFIILKLYRTRISL